MRMHFLILLVTTGVLAAGRARADDLSPDKDDTRITTTTTIKPGTYRVIDAGNDGAIQIRGDEITVDFQQAELIGSAADALPDSFSGRGIVIRGKNITLRNARIRGYKVGIYAEYAPGLTIDGVDVSNNYQQRLKSTPEREDASDWLFPHENDEQQWTTNHGAGISVARSDGITIRRVRAHNGQNGILLDRVNDSKIYDNDCSFLSGWGLGMWRSNRNVISRNAFDFCVRGYSHGVYNRGQDSAGILMFEQCCDNVIAKNSVTHGGDGFFGFAGREALGEAPPPSPDFDYKRRGNNDNLLLANDFSYAAAHGIEMTFSFGNKVILNRLAGNAICGVWGGYSQDMTIAANDFQANGEGAYGLERGGINIEHGSGNAISDNMFRETTCGISLWWDDDPELLKTPWAKANERGSTDNTIGMNWFFGQAIDVQLRETTNTNLIRKRMEMPVIVDADEKSRLTLDDVDEAESGSSVLPRHNIYGNNRPVGARKKLQGRQNIFITEWGPYDFSRVALLPARVSGGEKATLQVLGRSGRFRVGPIEGDVSVTPQEGDLPGKLTVTGKGPGLHIFGLTVDAGGQQLKACGTLMQADWTVKFFRWDSSADPRERQQAWDELIRGEPLEETRVASIDFTWGGGPPSAKAPRDHFGTVATATLPLPAGKWKVRTVSDDGIRVWIDEQRVVDDWTWHAPKDNDAVIELKEGEHAIRIEHFEIDGYAQLQFRIERAD